MRSFGESGSWTCPVCDRASLEELSGYCENCGLRQGATEKEVEDHRLAYARDPDQCRNLALSHERKRRFVEVILLLAVGAVGWIGFLWWVRHTG